MSARERSCTIAKITKVFGDDGSVVMRLWDIFPDEVDFQEPLFVVTDGLATPLFLNYFQRRGKDKAVARFDDIDTAYRAGLIIGCEAIAIEESDDDDELYYENMVGFGLLDLASGKQGEIVGFTESDLNPLFHVDFDGFEVIVPASDDLIEEIDEGESLITMRLPEGLLELYME